MLRIGDSEGNLDLFGAQKRAPSVTFFGRENIAESSGAQVFYKLANIQGPPN